MLPDLTAVPPWAAACLVALTTVTTALVTLARALVRALPQTAPARLEFWRELLSYRLKVRELKDARRASRHARMPGGDADATKPETREREGVDP